MAGAGKYKLLPLSPGRSYDQPKTRIAPPAASEAKNPNLKSNDASFSSGLNATAKKSALQKTR
jgi:hypothetical protein